MKIFFILLAVFLLTSSLQAYSKKIVIGAFSSEKNANKLLNKLPSEIAEYKELKKIFDKNGASVKVHHTGKYYLLLVEVFSNKATLKKSLKIIKKKFKHAYIANATLKKEVVQKDKKIAKVVEKVKINKKEIKKIQEVPKIKKELPKIIQNKQENEILKVMEDKFKSIKEFVDFTFLIIFILFMMFAFYFVKFKKIYDEY